VNVRRSRSFLKGILSAALAVGLTGCVSLQSVSLTQIPAQRKREVHAEASKFLFFFISFDNDFVDEVRDELRDKCRGGKVTGILTKDESVNYFLGIFTRRRIQATGYCLKA
jgi:hypothetical protein